MRIGPQRDAPRRRSPPGIWSRTPNQRIESAPIRAFCASRDPSTRPETRPVHNFFSGHEGGCGGASPDLKRRLQMAPLNRRCGANLEISKHKKPHFIGTFSRCRNFARNRASKKSFRLLP
jgi:hypothetical protein